jgi:excinuclease ABC subunit C
MHEVLSRRYKRAKAEETLPSLIIVDGGKGQLNIALQVLSDLDIVTVDVIGLAKEEGRHDKGMTSEQVFLKNIKDPILPRRNSPLLFLLQRIRDEAHRVAITFHRQRQRKKTMHSFLDDIPGIGPVKRKNLLQHFGSVKKIKEASEGELQKVKGLSKANVRTLQEFIAGENN